MYERSLKTLIKRYMVQQQQSIKKTVVIFYSINVAAHMRDI